jgi:hypothetical protein
VGKEVRLPKVRCAVRDLYIYDLLISVLVEVKYAHISGLKQVCEVWREGKKLDVMLSGVVENLGCERVGH